MMFKTAFETFRSANPHLTSAQAYEALGCPPREDWVMSKDGEEWTDAGDNRDEACEHARLERHRYVAKAERGIVPDFTIAFDGFKADGHLMYQLTQMVEDYFVSNDIIVSAEEGTIVDLDVGLSA